MQIHTLYSILLLTVVFVAMGCGSNKDFRLCDSDDAVVIENTICIAYQDNGELDDQQAAIEAVIRESIVAINQLMPIDKLRIRVDTELSRVIPEIGLGGYNPNENEIIMSVNPNFPTLETSLHEYLGPLLAHEIHHARRRRAVGYGNTLLQAAISEGLADCFSIEVFGIDPLPWSVAITGDDLDDVIDLADNSWNNTGYNHSRWFFGTDPDIPRWSGYSIGFKLVKDYLDANPGQRPSGLFGEPADSFVE